MRHNPSNESERGPRGVTYSVEEVELILETMAAKPEQPNIILAGMLAEVMDGRNVHGIALFIGRTKKKMRAMRIGAAEYLQDWRAKQGKTPDSSADVNPFEEPTSKTFADHMQAAFYAHAEVLAENAGLKQEVERLHKVISGQTARILQLEQEAEQFAAVIMKARELVMGTESGGKYRAEKDGTVNRIG